MKARRARTASSMLDLTVALTVLLGVTVAAAQVASWSAAERIRGEARQEAIEAVDNVLESARAQVCDKLDADWAAEQKLPEALQTRLEKARLVVRVEPEQARQPCKRVSVELTWTSDGKPAAPVRLSAVFAPRTSQDKGGKP